MPNRVNGAACACACGAVDRAPIAAANPIAAILFRIATPQNTNSEGCNVSDCRRDVNLAEAMAMPNRPGLLVRIEENGRRTMGRFVRRKFKVVKVQPCRR